LKNRYFIELAYNGTRFHGWQSQPNAISVQSEIENVMTKILREQISLTGAGRTDAGVHARFYVAHFDSDRQDLHLSNSSNNKDFVVKFNKVLSRDIVIKDIYRVKDEAHSRFSAIWRKYEYHISLVKNPFLTEYSYFFPRVLHVQKMIDAAQVLFQYDDFTSFSKLHTDNKTSICKLYEASWSENSDLLIFTIKADRFLRNMVRAIVGTLIDVGLGKLDIAGLKQIIESKNRCKAGISVPAQGLFLTEIAYPDDLKIY